MPWKGWNSPVDPFEGKKRTRGGFLFSRHSKEVSDAAIDKILKGGGNPRGKLSKQLKDMAPGERAAVMRRIAAREKKRDQGKDKSNADRRAQRGNRR